MQQDEHRTIVDGVDFGSVFRFPSIFGAVASSMQPSRLIIGLLMVVVLLIGGNIWDTIAGPTVSPEGLSGGRYAGMEQNQRLVISKAASAFGGTDDQAQDTWTAAEAQRHLVRRWSKVVRSGDATAGDKEIYHTLYASLEEIRPLGVFEAAATWLNDAFLGIVASAVRFDPAGMGRGVVAIAWELPRALFNNGFHWFISIYGFVMLFVLGIGGGAIARMQAAQHARGTRMSAGDALVAAWRHWREVVLAVIAPAMVIVVLAIVLMIYGLVLLNIPVISMLGGILYGVALVVGLLIAVLAVGYSVCWPLLVPAVVVEHCDGGEAVQRSYAYLVSRPLHLLGYAAVAVVGLVLGFLVVRVVATTTLDLTADLVGTWTFGDVLRDAGASTGAAAPPPGLAWYEASAGWFVGLWETLLRDTMIGWFFSGFFSVSAMIYLLMRRACDGQDTREIWWPGLIPGTLVPEDDGG